ncbi:MAG: hypothetical protein WA858_16865, partial [Xanthobacteraceae bacterium]
MENHVSRPQARESSLHVVEQRIERTIVGGDVLARRGYLHAPATTRITSRLDNEILGQSMGVDVDNH